MFTATSSWTPTRSWVTLGVIAGFARSTFNWRIQALLSVLSLSTDLFSRKTNSFLHYPLPLKTLCRVDLMPCRVVDLLSVARL